MSIEELEAALKAVTDRMTVLDEIIKSARIGEPKVAAFRCNHSGLYFPPDYVKEWGKLYGVGLGPDPVSEVFDTDYDTDPPRVTEETRDIATIMHPLVVTRMQVDLVTIPKGEWDASQAVLDMDDPLLRQRARIVRAKQLQNPRGKLRALQASWDMLHVKGVR